MLARNTGATQNRLARWIRDIKNARKATLLRSVEQTFVYVAMMTKYRIYEHFLLLGKISELFMQLKATLLRYVEQTYAEMSTPKNQSSSDGCMDGGRYIAKMDKCLM